MMNRIYVALCFLLVSFMCLYSAHGAEQKVIVIRNIAGHGTSRQLALADAFRNAISQALGSYVVSSRAWDGEKLDKKIFDNADAVVKTHRVVKESEKDNRWSVFIDAEIVRNEMMRYIGRDASAVVGEGELANLLAKRTSIKNAVQSLDLLFQNWRENVYRVEKYGSISIAADDNVGSDTVQLSVPFIVTFRWEAYRIFLDKIRNVLSRISIDKAQGEYDKKVDGDFLKRNMALYCRVGLARKNNEGEIEKVGNPNGYGEVRIVSRVSRDKVRYEIYIIPNQVKQALDGLLSREAALRFSFTTKGGGVVASQSIVGEVYSFGWGWVCDCDVDLDLGWGYSSHKTLVTLTDSIQTDFGQDDWSDSRLYHASVAVPLDSASRISGCSISVCTPSEKEDCRQGYGVVTSESISIDEWRKIDQRPQLTVGTQKSSQGVAPKAQSQGSREVSTKAQSQGSREVTPAQPVVQWVKCSQCGGEGYRAQEKKCYACGGVGTRYSSVRRGFSGSAVNNCVGGGVWRCSTCKGRGRRTVKELCKKCRGSGRVRDGN